MRETIYVCSFNKDSFVIFLSLMHQGRRVNSVLSQIGPVRFESLQLIFHVVDQKISESLAIPLFELA